MAQRTETSSEVRYEPPVAPDEARAIARDAYVYGFPLVDNYRILHSYFVDRAHPEYKGPWNRVSSVARVYTPEDKAVQTPNSDTPYSMLGADLRAEPLVLTLPRVEPGRYFSAQVIDLYTFNVAYLGSRTTGNDGGSYLLAGPGWNGETPPGIASVIRCETELALVVYRTQLFGPDDIANVERIQAGYEARPLSAFLGRPAPPAVPPIDFRRPLGAEEERGSLEFFDVLSSVLRFCPTHPSELALRERFARIGVGAGRRFDPLALPPDVGAAMEAGIADAWNDYEGVERLMAAGELTSGVLFGTREHLAGNHLYRMTAAVDGIYGNSKEEASYEGYVVDSVGQPLDGSRGRYALRFAPDRLPPVNAFWSLTMYASPTRLLVENPLERYLINSAMLPRLARDPDRGVTIHVQHESPGADRESNWLPAPDGPFFLVLRLYLPKPEALDGRWRKPALERAGDATAAPRVETGRSSVVTPDNFRRAETDTYFGTSVKEGGIGALFHRRAPMSIDAQSVIRANRDTLYSSGVFDLDAGSVTITLPDAGGRFMSMMVLDEDHYVHAVKYGAGSHTYGRDGIGTRYLMIAIRTFVDPTDAADLRRVHALQDAIRVEQPGGPGRFEVPAWDQASQKRVRDALLALATTVPDTRRMFGAKDEVDPVRHLIGTAFGWGGNPERDALYLNVTPARNDGTTVYRLRVKDVPVDGFWSISVYDAAGYFAKNDRDAYSLNDRTAQREPDGSMVVQFGGCDGKVPNCLPITKGWNYAVRLYRPRAEILNGTWKFPEAEAEAEREVARPVARERREEEQGRTERAR